MSCFPAFHTNGSWLSVVFMPPSFCSLSPRALKLQHSGSTSRDSILASFIIALPKTWSRISDANHPNGSCDEGREVTSMGIWLFHSPVSGTGLQTCVRFIPDTDLWLVYRCLSSVTEGWLEKKAVQKLNMWLNTTVLLKSLYYLHLLSFASPICHYYCSIYTFFLILSSLQPQELFLFFFFWEFYNFHLSSGKKLSCVFSYWISAEGRGMWGM